MGYHQISTSHTRSWSNAIRSVPSRGISVTGSNLVSGPLRKISVSPLFTLITQVRTKCSGWVRIRPSGHFTIFGEALGVRPGSGKGVCGGASGPALGIVNARSTFYLFYRDREAKVLRVPWKSWTGVDQSYRRNLNAGESLPVDSVGPNLPGSDANQAAAATTPTCRSEAPDLQAQPACSRLANRLRTANPFLRSEPKG
jgi:hypothetical protein